jgi:hypothetical protein
MAPGSAAKPLSVRLSGAPLGLRMAISETEQALTRCRRELEEDSCPPPWATSCLTAAAKEELRGRIAQAEKAVTAAVADLHLWLERRIVSGAEELVARRASASPLTRIRGDACVGIRFDHPAPGAATLGDGMVIYDVHIACADRLAPGGAAMRDHPLHGSNEIKHICSLPSASDVQILAAIKSLCEECKNQGQFSPNKSKLPKAIKARLEAQGLTATHRNILDVVDSNPELKEYRAPAGRPFQSS